MPNPAYQPKHVKPRKVRGGIRLLNEAWAAGPAKGDGESSSGGGEGTHPESWAAQRWLRLIEQAAPGASMAAGLEYARLGQVRTLALEPGWVRGSVQGTVISAYKTSIAMPVLSHEQSEKVISTMVDQAVYAAKLLAGELPANIEDLFGPLGLRLFPSEAGELVTKCNCRDAAPPPIPGGPMATRRPGQSAIGIGALRAGQLRSSTSLASFPSSIPSTSQPAAHAVSAPVPVSQPAPLSPPPPPLPPPLTPAPATTQPPPQRTSWCKHACCLAYLVAERLTTDPFLIFTLRGLPREELIERLRQRRAVAGAGSGLIPVYTPLVPGVSDVEPVPLEESVGHYWEVGPELESLDIPITPPEVSHPLLRRLGPSPFGAGGGRFPLVGLLATCYEVVSEAAIKAAESGDEPPEVPLTEESPESEDFPDNHTKSSAA